jgi:hypothetical protein
MTKIKIYVLVLFIEKMGKTCNINGSDKNAFIIPVGKPDREKPLLRPRHRREDNIKMIL